MTNQEDRIMELLKPLVYERKTEMIYQFSCSRHGLFEVKQPIMAEHRANCPECDAEGRRIYPRLTWIWAGSAYRPDGSLRQDNDYAILKG